MRAKMFPSVPCAACKPLFCHTALLLESILATKYTGPELFIYRTQELHFLYTELILCYSVMQT